MGEQRTLRSQLDQMVPHVGVADTVDGFPASEQWRILSMAHKDGRGLEENGSQPNARPNRNNFISRPVLLPVHSAHCGDTRYPA